MFVLAIVFYGGYMLYNKTTTNNQLTVLFIVITFLCCIFFFFYGYYVNDYCYNPDKWVGDNYHCMLHIISSFGHHLITFL
jgi:phosphatidylglycerophosphate synthase